MFDFDKKIDRRGTFSVKLDRLPWGEDPEALSFGIADMDFPVAPEIIEALKKRVDHGIFGYTYYDTDQWPPGLTT